jgi:hypothetical protein
MRCPNKAEFVLPWAGNLLKACSVHARGISGIAKVIGSPIEIQRIETQEMCFGPNDLEEYAKAELKASSKEKDKNI